MRAEYNDNIRRVVVNEEDTAGYTLEPRFILEGQENTWNTKLDTKFRGVRYFDVSYADSDNVFLNLSSKYFTEISQLGFNASYEDNTTFDLEYDTQLDQSGLTDVPVEKETIYLAPFGYWRISEKANITLGLNASVQEYDENAPSNYNDYKSNGGNLSIGWDYSEKTSLSLIIQQSITESDDLDYENETRALRFSYDYNFSQNSDLSLLLGKSKVDFVYHNISVCQGGYTQTQAGLICFGGFAPEDSEDGTTVNDYSFEYTNKDELNETVVALSRNITASSSGSATQTDKYSINYERRITQKVSVEFFLSFRELESLDGLDTDQDVQRYRIQPSVSWDVTEDWGLHFLYRYIKQGYLDSSEDSVSNIVYMNLVYRWPKTISTY